MISSTLQLYDDSDRIRRTVTRRLETLSRKLDFEWRNAGLGELFGSSMIATVLRFLERTGNLHFAYEHPGFAEAMLRKFWKRNGKRDAARRSEARERGIALRFESWDLVGDNLFVQGLYGALSDDLDAGETGRLVADWLQRSGWPAHMAWAFVWRESGQDWDAVCYLVHQRFSRTISLDALRKWGARNFDVAKPLLRRVFDA